MATQLYDAQNIKTEKDIAQPIRIRWFMIDEMQFSSNDVYDINNCSNVNTDSSNVSTDSSNVSTDSSKCIQNIVLLKREPKARAVASSFVVNISYNAYHVSLINQLFIDVDDRTIWKVFKDQIGYEDLISMDLNDETAMYAIDKYPSENLVSLKELKDSLISWYCV